MFILIFMEIILASGNRHKLYELKGQVVASGIKTITGMEMPVFTKRRFQHGVSNMDTFNKHFPEKEIDYRREFLAIYE